MSSAVSLAPDAMLASKVKQTRFDFLVENISKNHEELIELLKAARLKKPNYVNRLFGNDKCPLRGYLDKNHRITSLNPFNANTLGPALFRTLAQELIIHLKGEESQIVKSWGGPSNIIYKKNDSGEMEEYGVNNLLFNFKPERLSSFENPFEFGALFADSGTETNCVLSPFTIFKILNIVLQPMGLDSGILQESLSFSDLNWIASKATAYWLTPRISSLHKKVFKNAINSDEVAIKTSRAIILATATSGKLFLTHLMIRGYDQMMEEAWKIYVDNNRGELLEILSEYKTVSSSHNLDKIEKSKKRISEFVKKAHGENSATSKYRLLNAIPQARRNILSAKNSVFSTAVFSAYLYFIYKLVKWQQSANDF